MKEEVYVDIVYISEREVKNDINDRENDEDIRCDVADVDEVDKENEVDKRMG